MPLDTIEETAAALCRSRKAAGTQCDAPEEGGCTGCQAATEDAFRYVKTLECFVCKRMAIPRLAFAGKPVCGTCAPNALAGDMMMLDFADVEVDALQAGGGAAGEYLDSIGKTDLGALSETEWNTFLGKVLTGYSEHMRKAAREHPPF